MTITPEQVAAYVDGECDAEEARRIGQAAQSDTALAERIARERALRERLRGHFAPTTEKPLPAAWESMIRNAAGVDPDGGAKVIDLSAARARQRNAAQPRQRNRGWMPWAGGAVAASLVLGLMVGLHLREQAPFAARNGALIAQGPLARALDTQLASAQSDMPVRMLLTFRSTDGAICRAFAGPEASGIACHAGDTWQLRHILPGTSGATTEFRQAGSRLGELSTLAQGMADGSAFDMQQERTARQHGWR